ncbi:MAG: hypothetical protein EZS28_035004 [Streblomastix strix]|uniref:Uncharacterized protein n=1 Tax=Streblomastix strix TaxID=222440 RepID=A0A5J4UHM1_9EUKA|nr:MAG: hypothetical protein EZS28_035004 [Streblomastix strix]
MNEEDTETSNANYQKYKKTIEDDGLIEQVHLYRFFAYYDWILPSHKSITVFNPVRQLIQFSKDVESKGVTNRQQMLGIPIAVFYIFIVHGIVTLRQCVRLRMLTIESYSII